MKTENSRKTKLALKALLAALTMGLTVASPMATNTVHAELVDETDDWDKEGDPEYKDVTDEEQKQHDQDNAEALDKKEETPAEQDAEAKVDNSNGGTPETTTPAPVPTGNADPNNGEVTDWENYDPKKDENWDAENPKLPDGLQDEVDRKSSTPTPTVPVTPTPTVPVTPTPTPTVPTTPTPTPPPIPKTGDNTPWGGLGVALGALASGLFKVVDSRKKFNRVEEDVKVLTNTK